MKRCLISLLLCASIAASAYISPALLTTSSLKTCGTATDANDGDTNTWVNPTNAQGANDAVYATVSLNNVSVCDHLNCTNYGFTSSDVPAGATINGVEVVVRNKANGTTGSPSLTSIKLIKGGTLQGTDLGTSTALTTSDRDDTYGTPSNLWGLTLTQSDVTASNFGNGFLYGSGLIHTISVDSSQMRVTYTAANTSHKGLLLLGVGLIVPGAPIFVPCPNLPQATSWHSAHLW